VPDQTEARERMLQSALDLAARTGWRCASLAGIAAHAEVSLADAYSAFPTRHSLLAALLSRTDRRVLAGGRAEEGPARDRLFDILMRRFDTMAEDRAGLAAIARDLPYDPLSLLLTVPGFATSMAWMLEAAGVSSAGLRGALRINAVALIYLNALRTWLADDSVDKAKTMAALDRSLRRVDSLIRWLPSVSPRVAPAQRDEPAAEPPAPGAN
jgi:AcrR family transcriptional regulator